jgi:hypothetical protein
MAGKGNATAAFVLAALAAASAAAMWLVGVLEAREIAVACNNQYAILADLADCRLPAVYGALSWIFFTCAVAAGWVGFVRRARNAGSARAQAQRDRNAPPPQDAQATG